MKVLYGYLEHVNEKDNIETARDHGNDDFTHSPVIVDKHRIADSSKNERTDVSLGIRSNSNRNLVAPLSEENLARHESQLSKEEDDNFFYSRNRTYEASHE